MGHVSRSGALTPPGEASVLDLLERLKKELGATPRDLGTRIVNALLIVDAAIAKASSEPDRIAAICELDGCYALRAPASEKPTQEDAFEGSGYILYRPRRMSRSPPPLGRLISSTRAGCRMTPTASSLKPNLPRCGHLPETRFRRRSRNGCGTWTRILPSMICGTPGSLFVLHGLRFAITSPGYAAT
jgi:hypothetical protein